MDVRPVDPCDTVWELDSPTYRVYFWRARSGGYECEEFELDARDVDEAIEWAESRAGGRTFTLYAVVDGAERGLIRLLGVDPTREPDAH
jgi:hypothetical protein